MGHTITGLERTRTVLAGGIPDRVPVDLHNFMMAAEASGTPFPSFFRTAKRWPRGSRGLARVRPRRADARKRHRGAGRGVRLPSGIHGRQRAGLSRAGHQVAGRHRQARGPGPLQGASAHGEPQGDAHRRPGDRRPGLHHRARRPGAVLAGGDAAGHGGVSFRAGPGRRSRSGRRGGGGDPELAKPSSTACSSSALRSPHATPTPRSSGRTHDLHRRVALRAGCLLPRVYRPSSGPTPSAWWRIFRRQIQLAYHICGDATAIVPDMVETGATVLELDYKVDLQQVKAATRGRATILGPVDPAA